MTEDSMAQQDGRKVLLLILDGWGIGEKIDANAIYKANTPNFDKLINNYPTRLVRADGEAVGLPEGEMGTSEVNHMTIGAGKVPFQSLTKINKAIEGNDFAGQKAFTDAFDHVIKSNSVLHIKGLLSDGGVHSKQEHMHELITAAKDYGVKRIFLHIFTDGRDTPPKSAKRYVESLEEFINSWDDVEIASICGRYYAMDRDNNMDRTDQAFNLLVDSKGLQMTNAQEAIDHFYNQDISDEFIEPVAIELNDGEFGSISSDDAVIFTNFRIDRPKQLVKKFEESESIDNLKYVTMTKYGRYDVDIAFADDEIEETLGSAVSNAGIKQLRVTETEKFAHLTFFLNCKRELPYELEDRIMLDTHSDIKTHDEKPEMRAHDIANEVIGHMAIGEHRLIVSNICNADMVGHTGDIDAVIKAVEVIDFEIGRIVEASLKNGYELILTADHGNADLMVDQQTGEPHTAHTLNMVPLVLVSNDLDIEKQNVDIIDITPTILKLLGADIPDAMTGESFIK